MFHPRRVDREIKDVRILRGLLRRGSHLVLAMSDGGEPYAVPLNYVYVEGENAVYFHGAKEGRKMELLRRNPKVWCLVVMDQGFGDGQCVNLYASAMFSGKVEFVTDRSVKVRVLSELAEKTNRDPAGAKERIRSVAEGEKSPLDGLAVFRVEVRELTGKRSTEMREERLLQLLQG